MNKNNTLNLLLILVALLVTSCHRGVVIELRNNSGQDLVVVGVNHNLEGNKETVRKNCVLTMGLFYKLRVEHKNGEWNYDSKRIPPEFQKKKNFMISVIDLQIEKDGAIYVLSPGIKGPVSNFPPQPDGYPLLPTAR